METSQIVLNHGLTFLAIVTGVAFVLITGFLIKLMIDTSKLVQNLDETTSIVKKEIEPTIQELNKTIKSINSIAQNADKQVNTLTKIVETLLGSSVLAFSKVRSLSGGLLKGFVKGLATVIKLFLKK